MPFSTENPHHHLLEQQLPDWTHAVLPEQWQTLRDSLTPAHGLPDARPAWFANAAPDLREAVEASHARLQSSQHTLARSLKGLKQISEYAEPLLQARLLEEHRLGVPVRHAQLLHVRKTWHWIGARFTYAHERHSLLQAALQNFADDVEFAEHSALAKPDDIAVRKLRVQGMVAVGGAGPGATFDLPSEQYQVKALPLLPQAFAKSCRELDLGQGYQLHLSEIYEGDNAPRVRQQSMAVLRDRLRLAADIGYLRHQLSGAARDQVQNLLDTGTTRCSQLSLFGMLVQEVITIDAGVAGLLLYLPGHEPALRTCADLHAVQDALATLLLAPATRQAFVQYLGLEQRARFLDLLHQNLDAAGTAADDQPWQRSPGADLHVQQHPIQGDVFGFLQEQHVANLRAQARLLAVPTADADEQARQRRLAEWEDMGLNALTLASFFVPAIGTFMLAVTACQLLGEVVEGYEAWSIGDRHLALDHLEAVGLNLGLIAGLHAAAKVHAKLFSSPFMESLDSITLADDSRRLWRADLAPYRSEVRLPEGLKANAQGQYLHEDRQYIRIDGHLIEQRFDARRQQWRAIHPDNPDAYQPPLAHNGDGAWRGEHERPLEWPWQTLVRRLGDVFDTGDEQAFEQTCRVSGTSRRQLREMYLAAQPAPPLLLDTLERKAAARVALKRMADDPQQAFEALFAHAYQGTAAIDQATSRLCSEHPRLSEPLARRLLGRLLPQEREAWLAGEPLPAFVTHAIAQVDHELPLTRALEGIATPRLATPDSERLLLSVLQHLPGWSSDLRVELRAVGPDGLLLGSAGPEAAAQRCLVIKSAHGYEAYLGERPAPATVDPDLCRAVTEALPARRRQALGIETSGGDGLRQRVLTQANGRRDQLARRLWRVDGQGWRSKGRLAGGGPADDTPTPMSFRGSLVARYRNLFPEADDQQIETDLHAWRRDMIIPELELQRLESRLRSLREDLAAWAQGTPRRVRTARRIVNTWRRTSQVNLASGERIHSLDLSGLELENQDLASIALPNEFSHVLELRLDNNQRLSMLHPALMERFPRLRRFLANRCRFAQMPVISNPGELRWLDLDSNRITWDDAAQTALERLTDLMLLDLSDNPLLRAPDLTRVPGLRSVFMNGCSLTQLPAGLEHINEPFVLTLSDNQFTHLPAGFEVPAFTGRALRLESDWLSPDMVRDIDLYYAIHQVDLLVDEADYDSLLVDAEPAQRLLWERLPLQYRRDLRDILDGDLFEDHPVEIRAELWRRLELIDRDPVFRQHAFDRHAGQLLDLRL